MLFRRSAIVAFFLASFGLTAAQDTNPVFVFSTLAGSSGDSGSADGRGVAARFKSPGALAVDKDGVVYVADRGNSTVRKITPAGVVTTLAGKVGVTGVVDGEASDATFGARGLAGLTIDSSGNVFVTDIADSGQNPISSGGAYFSFVGGKPTFLGTPPPQSTFVSSGYVRKISPNGTVTTIAGGGTYTLKYNTRVAPYITYGGKYDGAGVQVVLNTPWGIAADSTGTLFALDVGWKAVRKITQEGIGTTIAGMRPEENGSVLPIYLFEQIDGNSTGALLTGVDQIAADPAGGFFIASPTQSDLTTGRMASNVKRLSSAGAVTTVAGSINGNFGSHVDGTGAAAQFAGISGLAVDKDGTLFIADSRTVRMMTASYAVITLAGSSTEGGSANGVRDEVRFGVLGGIAIDTAGNLYVSDLLNHTIRKGTHAAKPAIQTQPQAKIITAGQSVTLTVSATGFPELAYQWNRNGTALTGATAATLTLGSAQTTDAGSYTVTVKNAAGAVTSEVAALTVNPNIIAPSITTPPTAAAVIAGGKVVLSVTAGGTAPFAYQWRRNGEPIAGATGSTFTLDAATLSDDGQYTVTITNSVGTVTTTAVAVSITPVSRISNLSVLTTLATSTDRFTLGYVIGGASASSPKPLVLRAAGPALGALGVPGTVDDPKLTLFVGSTKTGENDNWGGSADLAAAFTSVGAFPFASFGSKDAATSASFSTRDNSMEVSTGATGGTGSVLAEIYDASPSQLFTTTTPRLLNVSVRKAIGTGLTVGFTIAGSTGKTVLIRAIGPTLGSFGVPGTVADPQLTLFNAQSVKIAENDDWGGTTALSAAFTSVGAFALPTTSKDAAYLGILPPGGYSVQVKGANGTTGEALVEIYEVP